MIPVWWVAAEVKPPKLADAIIESTMRVIANKKAWKDAWNLNKAIP